ncbi:hypothetical protein E7Y35_06605 [Spiroplasma sp. SV19]|nr:hypothetical protein E7Y35_06605 [Spiroplasma sp. SV19]
MQYFSKNLSEIKIKVPNLDVQKSIIDIIEPFDILKNNFENINKNIINIISKLGFLVINNKGEKN